MITRLQRPIPLFTVALAIGSGCAPPPSNPGAPPVSAQPAPGRAGPFAFQDVRPGSGLEFPLHYAAGEEPGIRQTIGHPAALLDADGDGRLDLLLAGPGRVVLFRNRGDWRFDAVPDTGFRQAGFWQGVATGDVDNDGRPDLFLSGCGDAALYRNLGTGRFQEITVGSGLANSNPDSWQTSAAFADVDRDGRLDLYVTQYVSLGNRTGLCAYPGGVTTACSPLEFPPQRGRLYRNRGGGRFQEVSREFGLDRAHGNGLGVAFSDANGDGWPDLYLANDQQACDLFLNQGGRRFREEGLSSMTAFGADGAPQAGMGVDFGDYDEDGREDIVVTNYQREPTSLYRNEGGGLFSNEAFASHIGGATTGGVGWGVKWADLDNDGRLDLALVNGHPLHRIRQMDPTLEPRQRFQLFHNQGSGRFREVAAVGPDLPRALCGRALCVGDLDNDGRLDLLAPDLDGEPLLLRNLTPGNRHWLRVRLVSRRVTEGARVVARAGERIWRRRAGTGGSYLSAGDPRVHLGLEGHARLDELRVEWPGGGVTVRRDVPADQEVLVTEGATATPR